MITDYTQAIGLLSEAKNHYNAGDYRSAYAAYESLAYFVCSERAEDLIDQEKLAELKDNIRRGVGLFAFCSNEALYEKSCELLDLFKNKE